jgi:hypothetical protein
MRPFVLRTPIGAIAFDPSDRGGSAIITAQQVFATRLYALHRDPHGHVIRDRAHDSNWDGALGYDLGSGLVTNVGVYAMANDFGWSASLALATLNLANQHAWGTGATAAAVFDLACQTLAAPTTATAVTGVQSIINTAAVPKYQTVATITAGGTLAITEWGLHSLATLSATTGTPFTATTATTWQDTGSVQTASSASIRGLQQTIVKAGTTTVWGLNLSNTTHIGTLAAVAGAGWWTVAADTAGSTPGATEAFSILPVLWDHKVFSAINVNNLDTIQFTYQLQVNSGG